MPNDMDMLAVEKPETGVLAVVRASPAVVLTDRKRFSEFYEAVAAEARAIKVDLTTAKGRAEIASMAHRIARAKTAIDEAGKKLNEDARKQIGVVDEARRHIRAELDGLRDEVRKPLDDWEAAEAQRVKECKEAVDWLTRAALVHADDTTEAVRDRLAALDTYDELDPSWAGVQAQITKAKAHARMTLTAAIDRMAREEADRAELARLRAEAEARADADRLAAEEAARVETARLAAERTEQARIAAEKTEAERMERERHAAAEKARKEAEDRARAAQEARDREHAASLERAEKEQADRLAAHREELARIAREEADRQAAAERAHQAEVARLKAEADRLAAEEAARKAEAERVAAEERRRAVDREHRGAVMKAAKEAIMEHGGIDEEAAKKIVLAIAAGSVPAVAIRF